MDEFFNKVLEYLKAWVTVPQLIVYEKNVLFATIDLELEIVYEISMRLEESELETFTQALSDWWLNEMPDYHVWVVSSV